MKYPTDSLLESNDPRKNDQFLFHYTTYSAALGILLSQQMRLGPLVNKNDPLEFEDHRDLDTSSFEYQLLIERVGAERIEQIVPSPNGKYILYVERIYRGTGTTDDEDVYYKVYSPDDGTTTTIYSGYRQYLLVDWK
jgi:hypothetical protein